MTDTEADGYTVRQAMKRLDWAEKTLRRRIGPGKPLEEIPGSSPKRVTRQSVERAIAKNLEAIGEDPETREAATLKADLQRMRAENEALRNKLQDARVAIAALNDSLGHGTTPSIPNN